MLPKATNKKDYLAERLKHLYSEHKLIDISTELGLRTAITYSSDRMIQIFLGYLTVYRYMYETPTYPQKDASTPHYIIMPESEFAGSLCEPQRSLGVKIIEELITENNPHKTQKGKIIMKYLLHLGLPYEIIENWMLNNLILFQHCAEIIYDYIVACWDEGVGLQILKAAEEKKLILPVLFPILSKLMNNKLKPSYNFMRVLYTALPTYWVKMPTESDAIINELKLYQIIISYGRTKLLNDLQSHLGERLLQHCVDRVKAYLTGDTHSVLIKKEALLVTAELWNVKLTNVQRKIISNC